MPWALLLLALLVGCSVVPGPGPRETTIRQSCGAGLVGRRILVTAAHCTGSLPREARILHMGRPGGPLDFLFAHLPTLPDSPLVRCPARPPPSAVWQGRTIRLDARFPALWRMDATIRPGESGTPLFDGDGALVGLVVARERDGGRGLAVHGRVLCAALGRAVAVLDGEPSPASTRPATIPGTMP